MPRENRTDKTRMKKRRRKKRYLLRFIVVIIACVGLYFLLHIDYFNINAVSVVGNVEISDAEIEELSQIKRGENIFDIHPWFMERRIKKNLYIEDANVNRKLPDKVEIVVTERRGKAQFKTDGRFIVADSEGMVLEISKEEKDITIIEGVTVEKAKLKKEIKIKESETYKKAQDMIIAAEEGDLYFKKIVIKKDGIEAYVYDSLVCMGRYKDIMSSIESQQLKSVIYDLYQKGTESGKISIGSNDYCSFTP